MGVNWSKFNKALSISRSRTKNLTTIRDKVDGSDQDSTSGESTSSSLPATAPQSHSAYCLGESDDILKSTDSSLCLLRDHITAIQPACSIGISNLKNNLYSKGWLRLSSMDMVAALKYFGATKEDLLIVANPKSSPHGELWFTEPALPWRLTQASRFILKKTSDESAFQGCDSKSVSRYEVNDRQLNYGKYWEDVNADVRSFELLPEWYGSEENSVYMAYQKLSHFLIDPSMDPAPGNIPGGDIYVCDHFCIRVTKKPQDGEMAQPSPEGVHQDGGDLVMITLMNRENVEEETGQSRVWHGDQPSGPYPEESFNSIKHRCHGNFAMKQPFETLLAIDSKVKHEARAIKPKAKGMQCRRDVIVHMVRTPRLSSCDTLGRNSEARKWLPKGQKFFRYDVEKNNEISNVTNHYVY